jgi:methyl halide transferase
MYDAAPMTDDVNAADYWENLYRTGEVGWDKGQPSPPIVRMLDEGVLPAQARLAVVGAGPGHEVYEAARRGYRVTAIDFAPSSVAQLHAGAKRTGTQFEVLEADLFTVPKTHAGQFDAVLEHTCFCAIDVARRAEYVETVHAMLAPGGLLFGLFYAHGKEGGPPFTTTEAEVETLFAPRFELERLRRAPDSFEIRKGNELEFLFRARR